MTKPNGSRSGRDKVGGGLTEPCACCGIAPGPARRQPLRGPAATA